MLSQDDESNAHHDCANEPAQGWSQNVSPRESSPADKVHQLNGVSTSVAVTFAVFSGRQVS